MELHILVSMHHACLAMCLYVAMSSFFICVMKIAVLVREPVMSLNGFLCVLTFMGKVVADDVSMLSSAILNEKDVYNALTTRALR